MTGALAIIGTVALLIAAFELLLRALDWRSRRVLIQARLDAISAAPEGSAPQTPWGQPAAPGGRLIDPVDRLRRRGGL